MYYLFYYIYGGFVHVAGFIVLCRNELKVCRNNVSAIINIKDPLTHFPRLKLSFHLAWQKYQTRRPTITMATPPAISPTKRDVTSTRPRLSFSVDHDQPMWVTGQHWACSWPEHCTTLQTLATWMSQGGYFFSLRYWCYCLRPEVQCSLIFTQLWISSDLSPRHWCKTNEGCKGYEQPTTGIWATH